MSHPHDQSKHSSQLPILLLPPHQIIFPKHTLAGIHFAAASAFPLLATATKLLQNPSSQGTPPQGFVVGCVPLKSSPLPSTRQLGGTNLRQFRFRILRLPQPSSQSDSPAQISISTIDPQGSENGASSERSPYNDLFEWGCSARVLKITPVPDGSHPQDASGFLVDLLGLRRFRIDRLVQVGFPLCEARVTYFDNRPFIEKSQEQKDHVDELLRTFKASATAFINALGAYRNPSRDLAEKRERMARLVENTNARQLPRLVDIMAQSLRHCPWEDRLRFLSYYDAEVKAQRMIELLNKLTHRLNSLGTLPKPAKFNLPTSDLVRLLESSKHLTPKQKDWLLQRRLTDLQRELDELNGYHNHQNPQNRSIIQRINRTSNTPISDTNINVPRLIIHRANSSGGRFPFQIMGGGGGSGNEYRDNDPAMDDLQKLEQKIRSAGMFEEAQEICLKELQRLQAIPPTSVEHGIIKHYLDIMLELPWTKGSIQEGGIDDTMRKGFLQKAKDQLDKDHFGMEKVKRRLIEFLAVLKRRADLDRAEKNALTASSENSPDQVPSDNGGSSQLAIDDSIPEEVRDVFSIEIDQPASISSEKLSIDSIPPPQPSSSELMGSRIKQKAPILLLVGPPGVGKTSIAKSIAKTLNKKFYRISLGGVKDESEIRGHRRTYVGSMPGVIVQALRRVGVNDPVILLDEIDKVGSHNFHGDPSAALLEVLDPEQNSSFVDHYINTPIDLSTVLFIATANSLATISTPLLDRMETIELDGYLFNEKMLIATRNLIPKQMENYNLTQEQFVLEDEDVLSKVILNYTRESGVRSLEREIGNLCRSKVMEFVEHQEAREPVEHAVKESMPGTFNPRIQLADLERILGPEKYELEVTGIQLRPGVAIGMAYQGSGNGSIMFVEAQTYAGTGQLKLTGSLGDVIKESAELALSWIKKHAWELNLVKAADQSTLLDKLDLHIHFPSGAVPKDGPSAGICLVACLVSLFGQVSLDNFLAMTGEISLRGQVLPVGGIREKVLAAHRAGIKHIIMPSRNRKDVEGDDQVKILKREIEFSFVSSLEEAIMMVFGQRLWKKLGESQDVEERKVRFHRSLTNCVL
ncbi:hypothetical protein CROQUDRAFT_666003 [Cronartium quercuum f. sp. fusiforme G11]|uniref:Lon proteolytic domain-containing protein n=1 Tax=Cronartium quercuum f. sp. fusiforme G11 TaxID=708437 RepID=A0A9P6N8P6_9BASI|nr:hypothetical protein CROQUDRAFT_666003 [Cronartium quercuum f. sp. fusiforme G11]